jgi:hypothetical protein
MTQRYAVARKPDFFIDETVEFIDEYRIKAKTGYASVNSLFILFRLFECKDKNSFLGCKIF